MYYTHDNASTYSYDRSHLLDRSAYHQVWNMETGEVESDAIATDVENFDYDYDAFQKNFNFLPGAHGTRANIVMKREGETLSLEPLGITIHDVADVSDGYKPTLIRAGSYIVVGYVSTVHDQSTMHDVFTMHIFDTSDSVDDSADKPSPGPSGDATVAIVAVDDVTVDPGQGGGYRLFEVDNDRF